VCDMTLYVCVTWLCMCVWHDFVCVCDMSLYVCVTWLCMCVWHDFVCVCDMTLYVWHDCSLRDMTLSNLITDTFPSPGGGEVPTTKLSREGGGRFLISNYRTYMALRQSDMTSRVWHVFVHVTWLWMCDVTVSYVTWRDFFQLPYPYGSSWVTWLRMYAMGYMWASRDTHTNKSRHTHKRVMTLHVWHDCFLYRVVVPSVFHYVSHIVHSYIISLYDYIIQKNCTMCLIYGVATISRLLKMMGLLCRISSLL